MDIKLLGPLLSFPNLFSFLILILLSIFYFLFRSYWADSYWASSSLFCFCSNKPSLFDFCSNLKNIRVIGLATLIGLDCVIRLGLDLIVAFAGRFVVEI